MAYKKWERVPTPEEAERNFERMNELVVCASKLYDTYLKNGIDLPEEEARELRLGARNLLPGSRSTISVSLWATMSNRKEKTGKFPPASAIKRGEAVTRILYGVEEMSELRDAVAIARFVNRTADFSVDVDKGFSFPRWVGTALEVFRQQIDRPQVSDETLLVQQEAMPAYWRLLGFLFEKSDEGTNYLSEQLALDYKGNLDIIRQLRGEMRNNEYFREKAMESSSRFEGPTERRERAEYEASMAEPLSEEERQEKILALRREIETLFRDTIRSSADTLDELDRKEREVGILGEQYETLPPEKQTASPIAARLFGAQNELDRRYAANLYRAEPALRRILTAHREAEILQNPRVQEPLPYNQYRKLEDLIETGSAGGNDAATIQKEFEFLRDEIMAANQNVSQAERTLRASALREAAKRNLDVGTRLLEESRGFIFTAPASKAAKSGTGEPELRSRVQKRMREGGLKRLEKAKYYEKLAELLSS